MSPSRNKGKKRAASTAPSGEAIYEEVHRRQKRFKQEQQSTSSPHKIRQPPQAKSANASRSNPFNPQTPPAKEASSPRRNEQQKRNGGHELARDERIGTLLSRPLAGKDVEAAVHSLAEESFRHLSNDAHPQPGRAFLEKVTQYLFAHHADKGHFLVLARLLLQQWRCRMITSLAETVTSEDEVKDIADIFRQNLRLDVPHHGFAFSVDSRPACIDALIVQLARRKPNDVPKARDQSADRSKTKSLKEFDIRRAAGIFSQYTEQLRLMLEPRSSEVTAIACMLEHDEERFRQLHPDQQKQWLRVYRRLRRQRGAGKAGATPWRLIQEQDVARLIGLDSTPATPTAAARSGTQTKAIRSPESSPATRRNVSSRAQSSDERSRSSAIKTVTSSSPGPKTPQRGSIARDQPILDLPPQSSLPSSSSQLLPLRRPSAATRDALRDPQHCTHVRVAHVQQTVRANFHVLFTTNIPDRPGTNVLPSDIFQSCQQTFPDAPPNGFKIVGPHTVAISFSEKKSVKEALSRPIKLHGTTLHAEPVFTKPPKVFVANFSPSQVAEGELKHQLAHTLRAHEGHFTVEFSPSPADGRSDRHIIIRFSEPPGYQCFFIPMRVRGGAAGERQWVWFKPVHPNFPCPVCRSEHGLEPCPQLRQVAMPSIYRP